LILDMKKLFIFLSVLSLLNASDLDFNGALNTNYGDNKEFYYYTENRIDLNIFYKDFQGWVQYEYAHPPEIGFSINKIRKFRMEYAFEDFLVKVGDIYEFWGRGLVLNQFDDQITNYDNGLHGLYVGYSSGPLSLSHINGKANIWNLGNDLRIPAFKNKHNLTGLQAQYDWSMFSIGVTQLITEEDHQLQFGNQFADVHHTLNGIYSSMILGNADFFFEYVDKRATDNSISFAPVEKNGHGLYSNLNLYLGSWGLSTEYKRYAFDKAHSDLTADDYGNRIAFQTMPTLGKEHNSTLLGRVSHNYNFNDERGIQLELNGSILDKYAVSTQYSHLSRNENWQSLSQLEWAENPLESYLPSSDPSALPYWENYQEISGYTLGDNLFFKLGRGNNKQVFKTMRYFDGIQQDMSVDDNSFWNYDTTYDSTWAAYDIIIEIVDSTYMEIFDTTFSDPYNVEAKMWQELKSFTIPVELNYTFDNGYSLGIGFQYQERQKKNISKGNSIYYSVADSGWALINPENPDSSFYLEESQFAVDTIKINTQYNRMLYVTLSKAPKWSFTITHDWTNVFDGQATDDPFYNPLEALVYGDLKYFTGERDPRDPPPFIQKRWVSAELAYNLTSSQRISIMYGSIQGGLFCSNGICRVIAPFSDGIKVSYSAIF